MQQSTGPLAFSLRGLHRVGSRFLSFEGKALALEKAAPFGLRHSVPFLLVGLGEAARGSRPAHLPLAQTRAVWMEEESPVSVLGATGGCVKYASAGPAFLAPGASSMEDSSSTERGGRGRQERLSLIRAHFVFISLIVT